ncbi:MAG: transglycosylase family protein [Solirubrobacterales bacterium]|nr:transglycosylase family protein [Solirubrobacterales bacterium]
MSFNFTGPTPRSRSILAGLALVAVLAVALVAGTADATAGGGLGTGSDTRSGNGNATPSKYKRLWGKVHRKDKRWARRVAQCESGRDPDAVALNGRYRGAFMFTRDAWKTSPKSPGGDPIDFSYRTQAVVAVHLKKRDGTRPWPVCG